MRHLPALAFALAATGAPAHADPTPNELSFGGTARALRSSSANALTADNLAGITLGAARDLGILDGGPLPGLSLWAEAGLAATSADGTMFQSLSTSIGQLGPKYVCPADPVTSPHEMSSWVNMPVPGGRVL